MPELVACAAEAGRMMCWFAWLLMLTEVLCEKDKRRRAACAEEIGSVSPGRGNSAIVLLSIACSVAGDSVSYGVVTKLEAPDMSEA